MRPLRTVKAPYRDRRDAGQALAEALSHHHYQDHLLVLALPRGGVAVGFEVAKALNAPLDIWVVRKLGLPGHEEYAMGAIASGGVRVMNPLPGMSVAPEILAKTLAREEAELTRRELRYRGAHPAINPRGRHVILVDDGLATGATMRAAALAVAQQHPAHLTVAVPVGSREGCAELADVADEVVCPFMPEPFHAVGRWYENMTQASDEEVCQLLEQAWTRRAHEVRQADLSAPAAGASTPSTPSTSSTPSPMH
jgi:predicted phosphoribosyltransferase